MDRQAKMARPQLALLQDATLLLILRSNFWLVALQVRLVIAPIQQGPSQVCQPGLRCYRATMLLPIRAELLLHRFEAVLRPIAATIMSYNLLLELEPVSPSRGQRTGR